MNLQRKENMVKNPINRICCPSNGYMLLQYLLLSTVDQIDATYFFLSDCIPLQIRQKIKNKFEARHFSCSIGVKFLWHMYFVVLRYMRNFKWPFLMAADKFVGDHLYLGWIVAAKNDYTLLEDGMANYRDIVPSFPFSKLRMLILHFFFNPFPQGAWGRNKYCKRQIYWHDCVNVHNISLKCEKMDMKALWECASEKKRSLIRELFCMPEHHASEGKVLLLTQPFSEDGMCTEEEKISLYRYITSQIVAEDLVVKAHPREKTDYHLFFPKAVVLPSVVPMELLILDGFYYEKVITVSSTAAMAFKGLCEVEETGLECLNSFNRRRN